MTNVTIVIPTYNRSEFLKKAITSIICQKWQDFRIFISDNASTDDTKTVVASFKDPRIQYYRHEHNIGMQKNWIFCLTQVKSGFVAFLEDDNYFLPDHLSDAIKYLSSNTIGFYFCNSKFKNSFYTNAFDSYTKRLPGEVDLAELLLDINIPASGVVFNAELVREIDFSLSKDLWCMDRFFWRSMILKSGFIFNPAPNIVYVIHADNITYKLLANSPAIAKASLQNRFVDAFTIYEYLEIDSDRTQIILNSFQKRLPDEYKHILPCFYGTYNNQDFKKLGHNLLKKYLADKFPRSLSFFSRVLSAFIIKNTNSFNAIISNYRLKLIK